MGHFVHSDKTGFSIVHRTSNKFTLIDLPLLSELYR